GVVGVLIVYTALATVLETRSISTPLPRAGVVCPTPARLEHARLLEDVRTLASEPFGGRRTGTEGSRRAQALLEARFRELGLKAFGSGYLQPFSFTHHSVRGLFSPSRPFRTEYAHAANVVGYLPGTRSDGSTLVLSAHYDHLGQRDGQLYPGADDN